MFSTDHKIIGLQYMFTGIVMAIIGGFMAYVFRMQLAFPGASVPGFGVVSPGQYNALVTNHGTIMIFWVAMPILIAGVWAGLLWGADGQLPLLISGTVGACFSAALLGRWALRSAVGAGR